MQSQDVDDIVTRVGALLDNPSNSQFDRDYLMPYIDQEYGELDNELESLGAPYALDQVIVTQPANTSSLAAFMASGQPLADMKLPSDVWWKLAGQPDINFQQSTGPVTRLDFVPPNTQGAWQWTFLGGMLAITPSSSPVDLQVTFQTMSTNIVDPQSGVILGTAAILALRVALYVATIRGMPMVQLLTTKEAKASRNFKMALKKPRQGVPIMARKTHGRLVRGAPAGYV
jgi:hypothetical protein